MTYVLNGAIEVREEGGVQAVEVLAAEQLAHRSIRH